MSTTIDVFWNEEPKELSEKQFLAQLKAHLVGAGISAIILANFYTIGRRSRQIDFLVVAEGHVCHVELKNYTGPVVGTTNGSWSFRRSDGSLDVISRQNPYTQAAECKLALSDDMHTLATRVQDAPLPTSGPFYTQFDSVVCVFPTLADGSDVPSDYRVQTLGYPEFLAFLTAPGPRPPWSRRHWLAFVRMLGLTPEPESGRAALVLPAAEELLSTYARRMTSFYVPGLHELVPLPFDMDSTKVRSTQLAELLPTVRHMQVVGSSGSGKSHLAKHMALTMLERGFVPIFIAAGMYEARLSQLLNRSVARFSTETADRLLQAAAVSGRTILLVVDGFNECPAASQERLLGDLSAFCLRVPAITLVTSLAPVSLPEALNGRLLRADDLREEDRKAVLSSYGAPQILSLCQAFLTAFELSIASECASQLQGTPTRASLFAAFIRKRLSNTSSPASTRNLLRQLALIMDEKLITSLPLDDVWRTADRYVADRPAPLALVDDVLSCTLVTAEQGVFAFSHELLGRFLAAEALALQYRRPADLARELKKPRHQDLAQLVVELEQDASRLDQLLTGLAAPHVLIEALSGGAGPLAARVGRSAALRLLAAVTEGLRDATFTVHSPYEVSITGGYEISEDDGELIAAVGALAFQGQFVREVAVLLDATDTACRRSADVQARRERRPSVSTIVSAVVAGVSSARTKVAASIILEACKHSRFHGKFGSESMGVSDDNIAELVTTATAQSHCRLLLLCSLLQSANSLGAIGFAPRVLRLCWDSGAYHVRLEGLMMIQSLASAVDGHDRLRAEIVDTLETLQTSNIMLSTQLVEALYSYDLIEPATENGYVITQIRDILRDPSTDEHRTLAYGIVSTQFEDVVGAPYFSAIESLDDEQRISLYACAARGAPSHGFWNDWLLKQLARSDDRRALPALEHWAVHLRTDTPFVQQVAAC